MAVTSTWLRLALIAGALVRNPIYARFIAWCHDRQTRVDFPPHWEFSRAAVFYLPWLLALQRQFFALPLVAGLCWASVHLTTPQWAYLGYVVARPVLWSARLSTGSGFMAMGPGKEEGGVIYFDMTGDPLPRLIRRQSLLGTLLSTVLDLPLLALLWHLSGSNT